MTCAQFSDVADVNGKISLKNIQPVSKSDCSWNVLIQVLNNAGESDAEQEYMWVDGAWADSEGNPIQKTVTFDPGQALWVSSYLGEAAGLRSAGQVMENDVDVDLDLDFGAVAAGNPFPVAIDLNDIVPIFADPSVCSWNVLIQVLNNAGESDSEKEYMWVDGAWCDSEGTPLSKTVEFKPGEGLWVSNYSGEAIKLRFAAPEI